MKIMVPATALGLMCALTGCASAPVQATLNPDGSQSAKVTVQMGYKPGNIVAEAGKPLKLEFYRDEEQKGCDADLLIPSEAVSIHLPNRESRIVELKPHKAGDTVNFECGMHMMHGKIIFK
jgi:plastocyanin domain-containing protein